MVLRRCTIFFLDLAVKTTLLIFWQNVFSIILIQYGHR